MHEIDVSPPPPESMLDGVPHAPELSVSAFPSVSTAAQKLEDVHEIDVSPPPPESMIRGGLQDV